jgi:hypothetical protein
MSEQLSSSQERSAALRDRLLKHADEIKAWREDDSQGPVCIDLTCEAEELLRDAAASLSPQPAREKPGYWPQECVQRAFVEGAQWWQYAGHSSTMFPSERDEAEKEAVRRYGEPSPVPQPAPAQQKGEQEIMRAEEGVAIREHRDLPRRPKGDS